MSAGMSLSGARSNHIGDTLASSGQLMAGMWTQGHSRPLALWTVMMVTALRLSPDEMANSFLRSCQ